MGLFSGLGKALKGVAKVGLPIAGATLAGPLGGLAAGGLSKAIGGGGGAGGLAGSLFKNADLILGGIGAIGGAKDQAKAGKLRDQALALQMGEFNAGAPLRDRARSLAMAGPPARRDLTELFADPGNPFSRDPSIIKRLREV